MARLVSPAIVLGTIVLGTIVLPPGSGSPLAAQAPAAGAESTTWRHPVDAPIVDYFRPPSGPYGAGNRGLEYGTRTGQVVVAVADGLVTFAGAVGGRRFVVVTHTPALRSTYAYLDTIDVSVGDPVVGGQRVASADLHFHLTARLHNVYVDPLRYLTSTWSVRLIRVRSSGLLVG